MSKARNRRRNHGLRRLVNCAYGLSLALGTPGTALAIAPQTSSGPSEFHPPGGQDPARKDAGFRLIFLQLEPADFFANPDEEQLRQMLLPGSNVREPLLKALSRVDPEQLEFTPQPFHSVRDGLGFDIDLPGSGQLHLDLYQQQPEMGRGLRMALNPRNPGDVTPPKRWSLGLYLDTARTVDERHVVGVVPQLLLDLDGLIPLARRARFSLEYGHWQPLHEKVTTDLRVARLSLKIDI